MELIHSTLSQSPLLASLSDEQIGVLAGQCMQQDCHPGKVIIHHLDDSKNVYFVLDGSVVALLISDDGRELALSDIKPGAYFGELAALLDIQRSASVVALQPTRLAVLPAAAFLETVEAEPAVALALSRALADRVVQLTNRCFGLATQRVETRLRMALVMQAMSDNALYSGGKLDPAPTHSQLAARVGTDRPVVSRSLAALVSAGAIRTSRQAIDILDVQVLLRGLSIPELDQEVTG